MVQAAGVSTSGNSTHHPWMARIRHGRLGDVGSKRLTSAILVNLRKLENPVVGSIFRPRIATGHS